MCLCNAPRERHQRIPPPVKMRRSPEIRCKIIPPLEINPRHCVTILRSQYFVVSAVRGREKVLGAAVIPGRRVALKCLVSPW